VRGSLGKLVLYYPHQRGDLDQPPFVRWKEELPLSLLAIATGYQALDSLEEWARVEEYWEADRMPAVIPQSILRARNLFMHYSSLAKGRPRQRIGIWERRARRKLETNRYRNARTEARAFHVYNRLRA